MPRANNLRIVPKSLSNKKPSGSKPDQLSFFDNLPKLLRPQQVTDHLGIPRATVYDWNYRPHQYGCPEDMFLKNGKTLYVVSNRLKQWLIERGES